MSIFPTKIVLATDGSEEATLAARPAIDLAATTGSELHVVYAVPVPLAIDAPSETLAMSEVATEEERERARRFLDEQVERIRADGGTVAQAHVRIGRPDEEIVHLSDEIGAGLIVVGSRGFGRMRRALMGSVSDSVVRHAHCPVLVVRPDGREGLAFFPTRILLAVDGSEEAALATRAAAELSKNTGSRVHIAYVLPTAARLVYPHWYPREVREDVVEQARKEAREFLDKQAERIGSDGGSVAEAHLRTGRPDEEIVSLSEELGIGLIVMGSRGFGGMRRALMGSVSNSVVRHAHCPVLVVRKEKQ